MNWFSGMGLRVVESGTEIDHRGKRLTVTESEAVVKGRTIYMTENHMAALKAHPSVRTNKG